mgnify:CR=1 FL=1
MTVIETAAAAEKGTMKAILAEERDKTRNSLVILGLILAGFDLFLRIWK